MSKSDIKNQINRDITENQTGDITAAKLNSILNDINDNTLDKNIENNIILRNNDNKGISIVGDTVVPTDENIVYEKKIAIGNGLISKDDGQSQVIIGNHNNETDLPIVLGTGVQTGPNSYARYNILAIRGTDIYVYGIGGYQGTENAKEIEENGVKSLQEVLKELGAK